MMWSLFCNLFGYSITICLNSTEGKKEKKENTKQTTEFKVEDFWKVIAATISPFTL